jgi:hypothetical protein
MTFQIIIRQFVVIHGFEVDTCHRGYGLPQLFDGIEILMPEVRYDWSRKIGMYNYLQQRVQITGVTQLI